MRRVKSAVLLLVLLLLLTGCGRDGGAQQVKNDPNVKTVVVDSPAEGSRSMTPLPGTSTSLQFEQSATPTTVESASVTDAQATEDTVDALIAELDALGNMLDSLDNPSDVDLIFPQD